MLFFLEPSLLLQYSTIFKIENVKFNPDQCLLSRIHRHDIGNKSNFILNFINFTDVSMEILLLFPNVRMHYIYICRICTVLMPAPQWAIRLVLFLSQEIAFRRGPWAGNSALQFWHRCWSIFTIFKSAYQHLLQALSFLKNVLWLNACS